MKKKGIGAIVAWVLLLGFSIALAMMVFTWATRQTETLGEGTVEFVEGEMQCQNIQINVKDETPDYPSSNCSVFDIMNVGYLELDDVIVREFFIDGSVDSTDKTLSDPLQPKTSKSEEDETYKTKIDGFCPNPGCKKTEFMPVIKISNRKVGCKDRSIVVKC